MSIVGKLALHDKVISKDEKIRTILQALSPTLYSPAIAFLLSTHTVAIQSWPSWRAWSVEKCINCTTEKPTQTFVWVLRQDKKSLLFLWSTREFYSSSWKWILRPQTCRSPSNGGTAFCHNSSKIDQFIKYCRDQSAAWKESRILKPLNGARHNKRYQDIDFSIRKLMESTLLKTLITWLQVLRM